MVVLLRYTTASGPTRTCSGTCHHAHKPACACICGGSYHGWDTRRHVDITAEDGARLAATQRFFDQLGLTRADPGALPAPTVAGSVRRDGSGKSSDV